MEGGMLEFDFVICQKAPVEAKREDEEGNMQGRDRLESKQNSKKLMDFCFLFN